jgi:hypothetical protein
MIAWRVALMKIHSKSYRKKEMKIDAIEMTSERLTGRAGLSLFVAYLHQIQIFSLIDRFFDSIVFVVKIQNRLIGI